MASTLVDSKLDQLRARIRDYMSLRSAIATLEWDQQTYMPKGSSEARGEHVGNLSRMAHELLTDDATGKLIEASSREAAGDENAEAMIRVVKRDYDLATKIPASLVDEKTRLSTAALETWVAARANNDFKSFAPTLDKMFGIARQEAEYLGYSNHIYDALLDQYEEGATQADCKRMFDELRGPSVDLIQKIKAAPQVDDSKLYGEWDISKQSDFTQMLVKEIGFNLEQGRQDTAQHPFCTNFSAQDVRLTTRYKPYIGSAIFGSLHEAGHGVYEQGQVFEWETKYPLLHGGVSLGLHESQSRTWENIVGRSKAFWSRYLPEIQRAFPELASFDVDSWYRAINKVESSFIRVEADEVTYNMHVMVRFEIECDLLENKLAMKDLPEAWNSKYEQYLGVRPSTDSEGCLQDVHWSGGSIGYFPTYSMGNLLSYQIWNAMKKDVPNQDELIGKGEFGPILAWLQKNVYQHGRKYTPKELVQRVTGKPIGATDYVEGLSKKYSEIYNLS